MAFGYYKLAKPDITFTDLSQHATHALLPGQVKKLHKTKKVTEALAAGALVACSESEHKTWIEKDRKERALQGTAIADSEKSKELADKNVKLEAKLEELQSQIGQFEEDQNNELLKAKQELDSVKKELEEKEVEQKVLKDSLEKTENDLLVEKQATEDLTKKIKDLDPNA